MAKTEPHPQAPPKRPDTWVESLASEQRSRDPLRGLAKALARQVGAFRVTDPAVVVGHRAGQEALAELREATALKLAHVYSFALADEPLENADLGFPSAQAWSARDAVLCLDPDPNAYLNAIQFCFSEGLSLPVLTDFDGLPGQFCQMAVCGGETTTDLFIFNYFTKLYRLKGPLQLIWQVHWTDGAVSRGTHILGPSQNIHLSVSDLDPPDAPAPRGTLYYEARHPAFARVPNSRFRGVADLVGAASCATLHGDEIEPKRSAEGRWFDTHVGLLGGGHDMSVVVRNDLRDPGEVSLALEAVPVGEEEGRSATIVLGPAETETEVSVGAALGAGASPVPTRLIARIGGRTCRLEIREDWPAPDGKRRFQCNHGSTNGMDMSRLLEKAAKTEPAEPSLLSALAGLAQNDVLALPYPLPVLPAGDRYRLDFSAGKFLPHIDFVDAAAFDRRGRLLGRERIDLPPDLGYIGPDATEFANALAEEGGMLLIAPPYAEKGLVTYQNCREDLWIRLSDRQSGDADISEFQLHNRNMRGYTVPIGFGQAPQMIKARTEMMIRYRRDGDFETRLMLINASPELHFDRTGDVELEFVHPSGRAASVHLRLAPQTWEYLDLSEMVPAALRDSDYGWVRVMSDNVALSAYAALLEPNRGAVGFQHLWGA